MFKKHKKIARTLAGTPHKVYLNVTPNKDSNQLAHLQNLDQNICCPHEKNVCILGYASNEDSDQIAQMLVALVHF